MTDPGKNMKALIKQLRTADRPYITDSELRLLLSGSADSRYSKVKRLIAQNKLLHIRKGLYCLTEELGYLKKPHPFELAQFIYSPSYISFESALMFHGLIPEVAFTTTSACIKRSKTFPTPLGVFSYLHLPVANFYTEVEIVEDNNYRFFVAKPWKAICDYVFVYKKDWINLDPLLKSLRIHREELPSLNDNEIHTLSEYYHSKRITRFLQGIKRELIYGRSDHSTKALEL